MRQDQNFEAVPKQGWTVFGWNCEPKDWSIIYLCMEVHCSETC